MGSKRQERVEPADRERDGEFARLMRAWRQSRGEGPMALEQKRALWERLVALARAGCDPVYVTAYQPAALFEAVSSGSVEAVELAARAAGERWVGKVDAVDLSGYSQGEARHETCLANCWLGEASRDVSDMGDQRPALRVAKKLLELGANPEGAPGNWGYPLISAARFGDVEMVLLLIGAGADPRLPRSDGSGVLHALLNRSDFQREAFVALVEAGADPQALDAQGRTPFESANPAQSGWIGAWVEREALILSARPSQGPSAPARL